MSEEKNNPKEHMLSGFFDRCREVVDVPSKQLSQQEGELDITGEIAKIKLKKILEIIRS